MNLTPEEGEKLLPLVLQYLSSFMVGFANITEANRKQDAVIAGSGTLVQADGHYGILTADHVLTNFPAQGEVGLILADGEVIKLQRVVMRMEHVQKVRIARASRTKDGPDLGLILLPRGLAKDIEAKGNVFYNLVKRKDRVLADEDSSSYGGWIVAGMVHEWSFSLPDERGLGVRGFKGFVGAGVVRPEQCRGSFDYFDFEVRGGVGYGRPDNFGGMSGGGLWRIVVRQDGAALLVEDALLFGVVFYQDVVADGIDLICHGRRSVYGRALAELTAIQS